MKRLLILPISLLLIAFGTLAVTACSSEDDDVNINPLLLNTWVMVSYGNESNEVIKEANGYFYIITFKSDGTYSGSAYMNEMNGDYKCNDYEIRISNPNITKVQFEGSDRDQFFLTHIRDVNSYTVTNTELRLYYMQNQYFKFRIYNKE